MPKINYDIPDLRAIFELARQGSFNRAADVLAITPSALSRRIAKMESAVGGLIVERTTRSMEFTALGKRLLSKAEPLVHALDDCMDEASRVARGLEGQVSIGCLATVAVSHFPAAVAVFKRDFPEVRVNLIDGESSAITSTVRNHEVEFAITSVVDDRKDLKVELVATDPFVLVCGINHPIAGKQKVRWGDLASEKLLGFKSHVSTRQLVDSALRGAGIELSWFYELGQLSSLVGYLSSGEFIAPVPKLLAGFVPGLVSIPLVKPHVERKIYLVRRDGQLSVPAQALWDIIRASFKA